MNDWLERAGGLHLHLRIGVRTYILQAIFHGSANEVQPAGRSSRGGLRSLSKVSNHLQALQVVQRIGFTEDEAVDKFRTSGQSEPETLWV